MGRPEPMGRPCGRVRPYVRLRLAGRVRASRRRPPSPPLLAPACAAPASRRSARAVCPPAGPRRRVAAVRRARPDAAGPPPGRAPPGEAAPPAEPARSAGVRSAGTARPCGWARPAGPARSVELVRPDVTVRRRGSASPGGSTGRLAHRDAPAAAAGGPGRPAYWRIRRARNAPAYPARWAGVGAGPRRMAWCAPGGGGPATARLPGAPHRVAPVPGARSGAVGRRPGLDRAVGRVQAAARIPGRGSGDRLGTVPVRNPAMDPSRTRAAGRLRDVDPVGWPRGVAGPAGPEVAYVRVGCRDWPAAGCRPGRASPRTGRDRSAGRTASPPDPVAGHPDPVGPGRRGADRRGPPGAPAGAPAVAGSPAPPAR